MDLRELGIEIEGATPESGVSPHTLPFHALADLVRSFVEAILAASDLDDAGRAAAAERMCLGRIESGSARPVLVFPADLEPQVDKVLEALESRDYSRVGVAANAALHRAFSVAVARRWNLRLRRRGWKDTALPVELSELAPVPAPPAPQKSLSLSGETVLHGRVVGIHGDNPPRVTIKPASGGKQVAAACISVELAIELGKRLYQTVGLAGAATWDANTLEMETFSARALTPYKDTPAGEAIHRVRESAQGAYDDPRAMEQLRALRSEP